MSAASKHGHKTKQQLIAELEILEAGVITQTNNQIEKTLQKQIGNQTEELLLDALENISDGFILFDADQRMILCNDEYREIAAGISDLLVPRVQFEALVRANAERGQVDVPEDQRETWIRTRLERFQAGNEIFEFKLADGRWIQAIDRKTSTGAIASIRTDITEKKNVEEELREREQRYRQIFDSAEVCLWDEDISEVLAELQHLRREGILDLRAPLEQNEDEFWRLTDLIKINAVNDATVRLFGAKNQTELLGSLDKILPDTAAEMFLEEYVAI